MARPPTRTIATKNSTKKFVASWSLTQFHLNHRDTRPGVTGLHGTERVPTLTPETSWGSRGRGFESRQPDKPGSWQSGTQRFTFFVVVLVILVILTIVSNIFPIGERE
jgi:hypothetical protein